ncbi:MAG: hypothetical protein QW374_03385 [Candidatus Bathyarchaeia archaeon]
MVYSVPYRIPTSSMAFTDIYPIPKDVELLAGLFNLRDARIAVSTFSSFIQKGHSPYRRCFERGLG